MGKNGFQFGALTVVLLVALRLSIGSHFLYEGAWKIKHADKFSATPFLTQAKGPFAPLFYAMVPDLDGRERLKIETDDKGQESITGQCFLDAWDKLRADVERKYNLTDEQREQVDKLHKRFAKSLRTYLAENQEDIAVYFGSLDRFEAEKAAGTDRAAYREKRFWDRQQELRREVKVWLGEIDAMGESYQYTLWNNVLDEDQRKQGSLPVETTFSDFLDFSITYGLTAIGLCLMLGLCTRLACLGGVAFLVSVLMTQPPWPTIYPPAPPMVGHALLVDKNFVEMMALLVLASTTVGRWAGLDLFLYKYIGQPLLEKLNFTK